MTANSKYGINPRLISVITNRDLSDIPDSPTASMLPGSYGRIIAEKVNQGPREHPENIQRLVCNRCGRSGNYDLGLVAIDSDKAQKLGHDDSVPAGTETLSILDCIQATGYFRCRQCNAAGHWKLSESAERAIYLGGIGAAFFSPKDISKQKFTYGGFVLADGSRHRWATDVEEYYLQKLAGQPDDAFTWNRLGNTYLAGGRPDLAAVAYEQSLIIDPAQMESHYSLAKALFNAGEKAAAAQHFRQALICAHRYSRMQAERMRDMLVSTFEYLLQIHCDMEKFLASLPTELDMLPPGEAAYASGTVVSREINIYPGNPKSFYPMAEMYMGKRREELLTGSQMPGESISAISQTAGKTSSRPGGNRKKKSGKKNKKRKL
ncbi:MAG: Tetratricopeptide repeat protein [Pelotomaculum sp. PtaB.Bin104]|nr:MAG: Tetratricopeptide repeat protein [Pelotomaculum sp. PtaB.Bin104]